MTNGVDNGFFLLRSSEPDEKGTLWDDIATQPYLFTLHKKHTGISRPTPPPSFPHIAQIFTAYSVVTAQLQASALSSPSLFSLALRGSSLVLTDVGGQPWWVLVVMWALFHLLFRFSSLLRFRFRKGVYDLMFSFTLFLSYRSLCAMYLFFTV